MDAYRRESAAVRGTTALSELVAGSTEWTERNDPTAYQERLNREIGALGETIAGGDEEARLGYLAAANPVLQQQIAANTAYNVNRIVTERETNAGATAARTIGEVNRANGGNAAPAQVRDALALQREEYIAVGGDEAGWNKVILSGVTTAAYNAGDVDLIDLLKTEELGRLYDQPGNAADLESTQYRIRQGVIDRITFAEQATQAADQAAGREYLAKLYEQYGDELLLGDLPVQAIIDRGQEEGYSMGAIASAIRATGQQVQQTQSLQAARFNAITLDPTSGRAIVQLFTDVARNPTAPGLEDRLEQAYLEGKLSPDDYTRLATQVGNGFQALATSGGSGGSRSGGGDGSSGGDSPTRASNGTVRIRNVTALNARIESLAYGAAARLGRMGLVDEAKEAAKAAAMVYLSTHPGDHQGAGVAASEGIVLWARRQSAPRATTPPPARGGNTRRAEPGNPRR
jgi:hypothetical protein